MADIHIAVPLRLMPNQGDELEVDAGGTDIDREVIEMVTNEFDEQALEEAVLIKEATGSTVTALAIAGEGAAQALQVAFAHGADRLALVDAGDLDPYDARGSAAAFAAATREIGADLVMTGVQTPSDVFGQTAPYMSAALGWPQVTVVVGVKLQDGVARVTQEYAGGRLSVLDVRLPAVIGVQSASAPPRYVSMARLRQAMSEAAPESISVNVTASAGPKVISLARPAPQAGATMLEGDAAELAAQIAAVLNEKGALVS